ncbi:MAG: translation initiation factor IF-1 [Thermodesulfobacteriota bacterium]|nr:translation initiation factor IF-1 [Thermodesulfobacteriota bacterium]
MTQQQTDRIILNGRITENQAFGKWAVELNHRSGCTTLASCYASGRLRLASIRMLPGDWVKVELSPYDLSRGRILYRFK